MRDNDRQRGAALADLLLGLLAIVVVVGVFLVLKQDNVAAPPTDAALAIASASPSPSPSGRPVTDPSPGSGSVRFMRPATGPTRVLFMGDAITRGADASSGDNAFLAQTVLGLRRGGSVAALQAASSSANASTPAGVPDNVALAVVELGTNDVGRTTPADFATAYGQLLDRIRAAGPATALVCVGTWHTGATAYDAAIARLCSTHAGVFVPLSDYFVDSSLQSPKALPNDRGHQRIAERLLRGIATLGS